LRNTLSKFCLTTMLWAWGCGFALAHHSFALFDMSKQVTFSGVVKEWQWTNPHCWLFLTVEGPNGEPEEWQIEALSPNVLGRQGWKKNSIKPGDKVTVVIYPTRDGTHGGNLLSVTGEDGHSLGGPQP
jgi:Family of unknown function (DUF6152)